MEFEWDENKRLRTLEERGLDFRAADLFFDGRPTIKSLTPRRHEERWKTSAEIEGTLYTLIWTPRVDKIRIISIRRAHDDEERTYRSLHR